MPCMGCLRFPLTHHQRGSFSQPHTYLTHHSPRVVSRCVFPRPPAVLHRARCHFAKTSPWQLRAHNSRHLTAVRVRCNAATTGPSSDSPASASNHAFGKKSSLFHRLEIALAWWDVDSAKREALATDDQNCDDQNCALSDAANDAKTAKGETKANSKADDVKNVRSILRQIMKLSAPDKIMWTCAFAFLTLASLTELCIPYLVSSCLTLATQGQAGQAAFQATVRQLGMLALVYGAFSGTRGFLFSVLNQRMVRRLRDGVYAAVIQQDMGWLDRQDIGELTSRLNNDTSTVASTLGLNINIMLRNGLQAVGGGVLLVRLNGSLALVTLSVTLLYLALSQWYGSYSRQLATIRQDSIAATNQVAEETLARALNVRVFGAELREVQRYNMHSLVVYNLRLRCAAAWGLFHGFSSFIFHNTKAVALMVGGSSLAAGTTTAAQLTTFVLYVDMVVSSSLAVCEQWAQVLEAVGASERVMELLQFTPSKQLSTGIILPMSELRGDIVFKDVSFRYPARPETLALQNVDVTLEAGKVTAFVGGSGSGKSTVAKLCQRLYDPDEGSVNFDGVPITTLDSAWFRSLLGVVNQEPRLFPSDVSSNIRYGAVGESDSAVQRAAELANAHDFIALLPEGYGTKMGEGRLSGGQQQRVAIARALIREPYVLILDEATSALDAQSEAKVQEALDGILHATKAGVMESPTIMVIAHKLATIRNADKIVVMDSGKVVEQGTHDELLNKQGKYAALWQQQQDQANKYAAAGSNWSLSRL